MTDEQSWLARITAAPADNDLRLGFADWLDTQGDVGHAELIRVQLALAQPHLLQREEYRRLRQRQRALLKGEARLAARLPSLPGVNWVADFHHGLLSFVSTKDFATFEQHAETIFRSTVIRSLSIYNLDAADTERLLDRPEIERLVGLYLHIGRDALGSAGVIVRIAVGSPRLAHLRAFGISGWTSHQGMPDEGARLIAASPHLAQVRRLSLANNTIGAEGAAALATSPFLANVRSLDLLQNEIGDDGLIAIARSSTLKSLRSIQIYANKHTDKGIRELVRGPLAGQFRELWVGGGKVTWRGARAIAHTPALSHLRILDLDNTDIGDAGLIEIANSPSMRRLQGLYLRSSSISDASVAVLARSPVARRLRHLDLENNPILDIGAWELVRSPNLEQIQKMKLWDCDDLEPPVRFALKRRFGERVEIHIDPEDELAATSVHQEGPTTQESLLEAIRRHPEEDAPRLVYADWLEDNASTEAVRAAHGEERAEFIRMQCRFATLAQDDPERLVLQERISRATVAHSWDWTAGAFQRWLQHPPALCPLREPHAICKVFADALLLGKSTDKRRWKAFEKRLDKLNWGGDLVRLPLFAEWTFERGFLDRVSISEAMFLIFAPAVRDLGMVRHLHVQLETSDDMEIGDRVIGALIATMEDPRLRTLGLATFVDQLPPLQALAVWRGVEELTQLTGLLTSGIAGDLVVKTLARSRYLRKLEVFDVDSSPAFTDASVETVLASPYWRNLKQMRLLSEDTELSPEVVERFRARFGKSPLDA